MPQIWPGPKRGRPAKRLTWLRMRPILLLSLTAALLADTVLPIPPVRTSLELGGLPVEIDISGTVAQRDGESSIQLDLQANLESLQRQLTPILQSELNQNNRCGERLAIQEAELIPTAPAARLRVALHVEKWSCLKLLGKDQAKRLAGGDGVVMLRLTPVVEEGKSVRLAAEVESIEADGSLGELLKSGPIGAALQEKIKESLVKAIRKATDFKAMLPPKVAPFVTLDRAAFAGNGRGLVLRLNGRLQVDGVDAAGLLGMLRSR